jgi:hypothetical protein
VTSQGNQPDWCAIADHFFSPFHFHPHLVCARLGPEGASEEGEGPGRRAREEGVQGAGLAGRRRGTRPRPAVAPRGLAQEGRRPGVGELRGVGAARVVAADARGSAEEAVQVPGRVRGGGRRLRLRRQPRRGECAYSWRCVLCVCAVCGVCGVYGVCGMYAMCACRATAPYSPVSSLVAHLCPRLLSPASSRRSP